MRPNEVSPFYFWATVAVSSVIVLLIFIVPVWGLLLLIMVGILTIVLIIISMLRADAKAGEAEE